MASFCYPVSMTVLFFVVAFLAEVIGTLAGFGSSTILLPIAVLFFDFQTALVLVAFMHIFGNIGRVTFFKHGLDRKILIYFGVFSIELTLLGALLVTRLDQGTLKGLLGIFLVVYATYAYLNPKLSIKQSKSAMALGGGLSGFLAGLIGTGGALRGAFLTAFGLPKMKYIASSAAIALAVDLTRLPVYLSQGFLGTEYYWFLPALFVIAISGSFTGKKLVDKVPQSKFRKIVLAFMAAVGIKFIFDWL
jgi:uncharacterized protein